MMLISVPKLDMVLSATLKSLATANSATPSSSRLIELLQSDTVFLKKRLHL